MGVILSMEFEKICRRIQICEHCKHFDFYEVMGRCHCDLADVFSEEDVRDYNQVEYQKLELPKKCPFRTEQVIFQK